MIKLETIAELMEEQLNANGHGITFEISTDRGVYDERRKNTDGFIVPGVLTALSGDYEPLQGLKVYTMPISLELWCYACLDDEVYRPGYSLEEQKAAVSDLVESLNGATKTIDGETIVFTGSVLTVGAASNNAGGGCTRIPVLVQVMISAVENAVLSNDISVTLDGFELVPITFTVQKEKQGGSQMIAGTTKGTVINTAQTRVFNCTCYLTAYTPSGTDEPASAMEILENELLDDVEQNKAHTLTYQGREYTVTFQSIGESLEAGAIIVLSFTMAEFPKEFL